MHTACKENGRKDYQGLLSGTLPHLQVGNLVPKAGNEDDKRPVVRLHHHSSGLSTAHMESSWATAVRTLHTAASISFPPLLTEDTFLHPEEESQ